MENLTHIKGGYIIEGPFNSYKKAEEYGKINLNYSKYKIYEIREVNEETKIK